MGLGISDFAGLINPSDKSFSTGLQRGRQIGIQNQVSKEVQNVVNTPVPQGSSLEEEIGMAYARLGFPDQAVSFRDKGLQRRTGQQNIESTQQEIDKKKMENLSSQLDLVKKYGTNETFMNFVNDHKSTLDPKSEQFNFWNSIKDVDLTNNVAKLEKVLDESDFEANDQLSSLGFNPGMNVIVTTDLDTGDLKGVESKTPEISQFQKNIQSEIIKKQSEGGRIATEEDIKSLPPQAFLTLGEGETAIKMVKPARVISGDASTKFSVATNAMEGAISILNQLNKDPDIGNILRSAGTNGLKRLPMAQIFSTELDLITEGLGRALSGAAVPESEIANFRALFAINSLDTDETIEFKLKRTIKIVKDMRNLMTYGADTSAVKAYLKDASKDINKQTNQKKENPVERGDIKKGTQVKIGVSVYEYVKGDPDLESSYKKVE
jgi:hypothetical protein